VGLRQTISALLGVSAYQPQPYDTGLTLDSHEVEQLRMSMGGQLAPASISQTRWYLADIELAQHEADQGMLARAAQLMRAARGDGVLAGVLSTRTGGLVRLPKRFRGDPEIVAALELGHEDESGEVRSVFDEMLPPQELALLAEDGELLGVGVGELLPVEGRDYPVFVRLEPQFLEYRWLENRWYYRSVAGPLPIVPGDGRWVLHMPGGRMSPWQHGLWRAVGRSYVRKEHANLHKDNWEGKLANPARVAVAPQSAAEDHKQSFFRQVMAWGVNSVFGMTPGYDVKLLESNGRGWECFNKTIDQCNNEYVICIAGQSVTTDGGAGFQNSDIHKSIRADLIKATADGLAYTVNTQMLPAFIVNRWGEERLASSAVCWWDVTPSKDRAQEANSLQVVGQAIVQLREALTLYGRELDIDALCSRFGVPVAGDRDGDGRPDVEPAQPSLRAVEDDVDDATQEAA
jgi:hypothetical protein